jgi:O-antigen/teichoic acid export membrane protein
MMNREIAIVSVCALLCSGSVAVVLAFRGYSYWSLAWQQVVNASVLVVGRFLMVEWRPRLKVDFSPIRRTWKFSMGILVTMVVNTVNMNILTFVFGKLFARTPDVVGLFFQAFKWNTMAHQTVGGTIDQVAQPVLVSVRDTEEEGREIRVFRKMLRFTAFVAFPAMLGLGLVAHEFILATIGPRWEACVPLLRVLCIGGAVMPFYALYKNLIISRGRSDVNMWLNILQIALQAGLILMTYRQGIMAVVTAYTVMNVVWLCAWQYFAYRLIGVRLADVIRDTLPFTLVSGAVMAVTGLLTAPITNVYVVLPLRVVVAAALYVGVMRLLHVKMLDECISYLRS